MAQIIAKSCIKCSRWAKFPIFIKNVCFLNDVEVILDIDKGFIRETIRVEITGEKLKVKKVARIIETSVKKYNKY